MFDAHGGPPPPIYGGQHKELAQDLTPQVVGGAVLRFGVVSARTDKTANDTATVTINGIKMPFLHGVEPAIGQMVAWLEAESVRLCIGEYGILKPRIRYYCSTNTGLTGGAITDFPFGTNASMDYQDHFDHSQVTFPALFAPFRTGVYSVKGCMEFAAGDGNVRILMLKVNGNVVHSVTDYAPSVLFQTGLNFSLDMPLAAGDTIGLAYLHNATTMSAVAGRFCTALSAEYKHPDS